MHTHTHTHTHAYIYERTFQTLYLSGQPRSGSLNSTDWAQSQVANNLSYQLTFSASFNIQENIHNVLHGMAPCLHKSIIAKSLVR